MGKDKLKYKLLGLEVWRIKNDPKKLEIREKILKHKVKEYENKIDALEKKIEHYQKQAVKWWGKVEETVKAIEECKEEQEKGPVYYLPCDRCGDGPCVGHGREVTNDG